MTDDSTTEYQVRPRVERFSIATLRYRTEGRERTFRLEGSAIIGSGEGAEILIEGDRMASRLHAEVELKEDGVWVRDLGSRNGTFIDAIRIVQARLPPEGGAFTVGTTRIEAVVAPESRAVWPSNRFGPLVGQSAKMRELFLRLSRVASSDAPVLVHGETGTGKELVVRAIHDASPRAKRPFIVVDCGALPANLLESELFGHVRGAFTGAVTNHLGAVEAAAEGSIFLDEIAELPLEMQPKLLRALESKSFRRIGETTYRPIHARFLAASHRDLAAMVNAGTFREDLFFRLNVLPVAVPPLREHPDDIPLLVESFLKEHGMAPLPIPMAELTGRIWSGNVRELRSFVERAITLGAAEALAIGGQPLRSGATSGAPSGGFPPVDETIPFKEVRDTWLDHLEKTYIVQSIGRHAGNVSAVAEAAGLARSYVHRLIRKHSLDR